MQNNKAKLEEMAKKAGFSRVEYLGKKGIFNIYVCCFSEDNIGDTGMPVFLLENKDNIRYSNEVETESLMDML